MCLSWPPVRTPYYRPTTWHARNNHRAVEQHLDQPLTIAWASGERLPRIHAAAEPVTMLVIIVLWHVRKGVRNCQDGSIADLATE